MRIHRVSVRDFRGVASADIALAADGVTIVQGPNEVGKSSIADAIDMLLADPDSSSRARVKAAQPVGRDVGPWVEMDFETGPYRLVYSKRWVKGAATELRVHGPVPEQHTGRGAHDRVAEILAETLDAPLFAALRHQQGMPLDQADLGSSATLARALDVAAGAGSASDDDALIDRIDAERQVWSTPGGAPNKARLDLRAAAAQAEAEAQLEHDRLRAVEDRVDDHRRLTRDIEANMALEPEMRRRDAQLARDLEQVSAREAAVRDLDAAAQAAEASARAAADALAARMALIAAETDAGERVRAVEAEQAALGERLAAADDALQLASQAATAATAAVRDAEAALDTASVRAQQVRDDFDLEVLVERRGQVDEAEGRVARCEAWLAECTMTPDLMKEIEDAATDEAVARGRLEASGVRLRVVAERRQDIQSAGGHHSLGPGEDLEVDLAPGSELVLPGVARMRLEGHADEARAAAEAAAGRLSTLLARAGIDPAAGVAAARAQEHQRLAAERELAAARDARTRALRDLTPGEMDDKIARARDRAAAHGTGQPPHDAPASLDDANAERARCASARDDARRGEAVALAARDEADAAARDLRAAAAECGGRLRAEGQRRDDAGSALSAAREVCPDDALEARAVGAREAAAAARERHAEQAAALADDDPDSLRTLAANASGALDRLLRERNEMAMAAERLAGEIGRAGDDGLADLAAAASERALHAADALARAEREAGAADLLHEVMTRHLDQARRAYVAPFRAEVERLARLVFGPGTTVEIDHAGLGVVSRTRDGVTVPYEALSGGAREQLAVIGRLAAASLVADDGGAPVIIDDALGYSDPARLEGIGAALARAGEGAQVIVLTCMPDRYAGIGSATVVRMEPGAGRDSAAGDVDAAEVA